MRSLDVGLKFIYKKNPEITTMIIAKRYVKETIFAFDGYIYTMKSSLGDIYSINRYQINRFYTLQKEN